MNASSPIFSHPSADGVWHHIQEDAYFPLSPIAHQDLASTSGHLRPMSLVVQNQILVWAGPSHELPSCYIALTHYDCRDCIVTPGLVDCHTHLVYAGHRANEFAMRLEGASYEAIAKAGGGIISTVNATRQATEDELFAQSAPRLEALLAEGVCALEIKSGYGLSLADERKQLKVARRLSQHFDVKIQTTFLGAHALPPEYAGRPDDYIDLVCQEITQGSGCTIVACEGKLVEYAVTPLPKEQLVDTNGAGDAFVGGFLAGLLAEKSVGDSVEAGHWAARFIIQQSGCSLTKACDLKL